MKNTINKALLSTILLTTLAGGTNIQTVLATENNTLNTVQTVDETQETTEETLDTGDLLPEDTTATTDIESTDTTDIEVTKIEKELPKQEVKEVKEVKKETKAPETKQFKAITQGDFYWSMKYKSTNTTDYLNARNTDFKYTYNRENNVLKVKYKDFKEQEMSVYEEGGELYSEVSYKFTENTELSEVSLGLVKIDFENKQVESIQTDYIHFSPEILENNNLEPVSNAYTTDNFEHTVLYRNIVEDGKYVIQKYAMKDELENLNANTDNTLLLYENRQDAVFLTHNLRHITKKEVQEQSDAEGTFNADKDYVELTDDKISLSSEDIAIIHNHFYPQADGYNYINANNTTSSKLAYTFNGKGDLTFKIDNIMDTNATLNEFKYVFNLDETLKTSDTYQTMLGQTREKSYKIYMNDLQQTNEVRLKATFNADNIVIELDRDSMMAVGKTSEIYALSMFIDNFEAPIIEEPVVPEPPKPVVKEVKKEVEKPKVTKLPQAGNTVNTGLISILSTLLGTTSLYIFRRR